ncbi:hypothetical protein DJ010_14630 [Nocardioides silvaticus]|uniref:Uncharacterized protein n=1 Tax=Nocardioides silvaticus TaxID=2201891 RepID=A0A316TD38_9ACTN|nr:hypothetical protein [Nocardioides silvaticus]PWN02340.1 hypothetical protein DJ010_14630 [Nocardioides silvaticus]
MTAPAVDQQADQPDHPEQAEAAWSGWSRRIGTALLVGWVMLLASTLLVGEREASPDSLEHAIASGNVQDIEAAGGLGRASGTAMLELRWRDGIHRYYAEVREMRPMRQNDYVIARSRPGQPPRVRAGLVERLQQAYPDLRVAKVGDPALPTVESELLGWRLPGWTAGVGLVLTLGTLLLLIAGPQPWRATKWAWFWLSGLAPPLGQLAYLVVGGPTPLGRPPARGARRLTGGWAFLVAVLVSAAFGVTFSIF